MLAGLARILRGGGYHALHSHVLLFGGALAAAAAAARTPVRAVHAHNSHDGHGDRPSRRLYRNAMRASIRRFANLRLACSQGAADWIGGDAEIFPYGLDLSAPAAPAGDLRAELGLSTNCFVIGHVGRLHPQKNQLFLLNGFKAAARLEPRLRLVIVGEGELRATLEERVGALGLEGKVMLAGRRPNVPQLLRHVFDAFAMPSLYEGLPVALLEAQAAGLPCLVSAAISAETFAVPALIKTLPLDGDWAAGMLELLRRARAPRPSRDQAAAALRAGGFAIDDAWERLTALYDRTAGGGTLAALAAEAA